MSHSAGWCGWVETPSLWFSLKTPDPFSVSHLLFLLSRRWSTAQAQRQLDGVLCRVQPLGRESLLFRFITEDPQTVSETFKWCSAFRLFPLQTQEAKIPWAVHGLPVDLPLRWWDEQANNQRNDNNNNASGVNLWSSLIEAYRGVLAVSERAAAQAPCWNWQQVELWHVSWEHGSASRRFGAVAVFADSANWTHCLYRRHIPPSQSIQINLEGDSQLNSHPYTCRFQFAVLSAVSVSNQQIEAVSHILLVPLFSVWHSFLGISELWCHKGHWKLPGTFLRKWK